MLGHTAISLRIGGDTPAVAGRTPFLGVLVAQSVPLAGEDATRLQVARVEFRVRTKNPLNVARVADRLEVLLHAETDDPNTGYWDASDTNISNRQTRFKIRRGLTHEPDSDVWTVVVEADLIWASACS